VSAASARLPLEARVSLVLKVGTYAAIGLVAAGVVLMTLDGRSPLDVAPAFDPSRLPGDLAALRPSGFLWLGVLLVLATPPARVLVALIGYLRGSEREMALVALLILIVIALGVVAGTSGN
jgi:uncharacterized membrane protein